MRFFLNAIKESPHPEEARSAVSKDAGYRCSPEILRSADFLTASEAGIRGRYGHRLSPV